MSKASDLTNQIIDFIYRNGGYAWRASSTGVYDPKGHSYRTSSKTGVSDILGLYKGHFIAVEVKIGKDKLSDVQEGFLVNIDKYGGVTFVVHDFDSFVESWDYRFPIDF
jgi:penicillin-binding protein-related factor A (putative recombinase)